MWNLNEEATSPGSRSSGVFGQDSFSAYRSLRTYGAVQWLDAGPNTTLWLVTHDEVAGMIEQDSRLVTLSDVSSWRLREHLTSCPGPGSGCGTEYYRSLITSFSRKAQKFLNADPESAHRGFPGNPFLGIADELLSTLTGIENSVDLVEDFTIPYAVQCSCEVFGIPEDDRADFTEWLYLLMMPAENRLERAAGARLENRIAVLLTERLVNPARDLLTDLAGRIGRPAASSEQDAVRGAMLLLLASVECMVSALGSVLYAVLREPGSRFARLPLPAVRAALAQRSYRHDRCQIDRVCATTTDMWIGDRHLRHGDLVAFATRGLAAPDHRTAQEYPAAQNCRASSGHRGASYATAAEGLRLTGLADQHLAFANWAHRRLDTWYVQRPASIALARLLDRYPSPRLTVEPATLDWLHNPFVDTVRQLPVRLGEPAGNGTRYKNPT